MKHTKGPWVTRDATFPGSRATRFVVLETKNGFTVADTGNADVSNSEGNAHLIAAAPELLEALKLCQEELMRIKRNESCGVSELALGLAELALKAAEGAK